jgi:hypothetical protein
MFRPINEPSSVPGACNNPDMDDEDLELDGIVGPVELLVSNLDYNISAALSGHAWALVYPIIWANSMRPFLLDHSRAHSCTITGRLWSGTNNWDYQNRKPLNHGSFYNPCYSPPPYSTPWNNYDYPPHQHDMSLVFLTVSGLVFL